MNDTDPQNTASAPDPTLGQAIKRRRRELGLRQVDLADLAAVSIRLVETVEQGVGSPRLSSMLALCRALGLELVLRPGRGELRLEDL